MDTEPSSQTASSRANRDDGGAPPDLRDVTVVVVPRERFSYTRESLESLVADRDGDGGGGGRFRIVVVDAGSPAHVARYLTRRGRQAALDVVRVDRYLPPNTARNLGLARVTTPFVAFVDNDVVVTRGWLTKLVACARDTGAAVVGPLTLIGPLEQRTIHMAGGLCRVVEDARGRRALKQGHRFMNRRVDDVAAQLVRERTEMVELHCCLVETAFLRDVGGVDERLMNTREHIDLCLTARERGREVWLEPSSVVAYVPPPPFSPSDVPFFWLRWSDAWGKPTLEHFFAKWRLDDDDDEETLTWLKKRRYRIFDPAFSTALALTFALFGKDRVKRFARRFVYPIEGAINRRSTSWSSSSSAAAAADRRTAGAPKG